MPVEAHINRFCLLVVIFFIFAQWDDPISCMILGGCITLLAQNIIKYGL